MTVARTEADIWMLAGGEPPLVLPVSSSRLDLLPSWNSSGDRFAFFSDRTGSVGLWTADAHTSLPVRLGAVRGSDFTRPVWFPEGHRIAWGSSLGIHIVDVSSGTVRDLDVGPPINLEIASDGNFVYTADTGAGPHVRLAHPNGEERILTPRGQFEFLRRVDSEGVYVTPANQPRILRYRRFDAPASARVVRRDIPVDAGMSSLWSIAGNDIYYVTDGPVATVRVFDSASRVSRELHAAGRGVIRGLSVTADGSEAIFDVIYSNGLDILLVEPASDFDNHVPDP